MSTCVGREGAYVDPEGAEACSPAPKGRMQRLWRYVRSYAEWTFVYILHGMCKACSLVRVALATALRARIMMPPE